MGEWSTAARILTLALDGGEWSPSGPGRLTHGERSPCTHWIEGWVNPRAGLDEVVKKKNPSRESNPNRPAHSLDTILTAENNKE
jgi:hypothetical protein